RQRVSVARTAVLRAPDAPGRHPRPIVAADIATCGGGRRQPTGLRTGSARRAERRALGGAAAEVPWPRPPHHHPRACHSLSLLLSPRVSLRRTAQRGPALQCRAAGDRARFFPGGNYSERRRSAVTLGCTA